MMLKRLSGVGAVLLAIVLIRFVEPPLAEPAAAQSGQPVSAPTFEWDPTWPGPLPEKWAVGPVVGVSVDADDHIWVIHRQSVLLEDARYTAAAQDPPIAECCIPAPPILEFDRDGNLLSSWGGPGAGYEWPQREHGIHVDASGYVWTAGNGPDDAHILKFTRDGTFVLQIGRQGQSGGNQDTRNLQRAADMKVDPATNELYVADGYGNRRVIVFDADSGAFKRMWGAYGNRPDDADIGPYDPDAPPAQQFRTAHGIGISSDGLVYVGDRANDRVQVFTRDGAFVKEQFIARHTLLSGAASGVAFSADPAQQYLYVLDGANHRVWIALRESLEILGHFGRHGHWGGQLDVPHNVDVDSSGNLYITETLQGRRVQRFLYQGLAPVER